MTQNNEIENTATKIINENAHCFSLATTGFKELYKYAEYNYNKAASSGDSSTAASSGDSSTAASSGNRSKAASSGYSSTAASSGDYSEAASSGDYSEAASSGDYSKAASSGYSSTAASSGNRSKAASSGDYSKAASSGDYSKAASSGYSSKAASSGDSSTAASSGDYSKAASSGYSSTAASSGNRSKAASSGDYSKAASSGNCSACTALGYRAAVKGEIGNLLMCSEFKKEKEYYTPIGGKANIVDGEILKPNRWYIVKDDEWVEVDFTDNIFSYVLSNKGNVKKVRTEEGNILFVVSDENGNTAHGKTIEQAREGLIYKITANFNGKIPETATGKEWIGIYKSVTGAYSEGIKMFVLSTGKNLDNIYTYKEIINITSGQFGSEMFLKKCQELRENENDTE